MKYYLRFKRLPKSGKSGIYRRGVRKKIGVESGVSVFELVDINGCLNVVFPAKITNEYLMNSDMTPEACSNDFSMLWWEWVSGRISAFLVTGDEIGKGSDGEPLLINVKIIKRLKRSRNSCIYKK